VGDGLGNGVAVSSTSVGITVGVGDGSGVWLGGGTDTVFVGNGSGDGLGGDGVGEAVGDKTAVTAIAVVVTSLGGCIKICPTNNKKNAITTQAITNKIHCHSSKNSFNRVTIHLSCR